MNETINPVYNTVNDFLLNPLCPNFASTFKPNPSAAKGNNAAEFATNLHQLPKPPFTIAD